MSLPRNFEHAFNNLNDDDRKKLGSKLSEWESVSKDHQKLVSNLFDEHFATVDLFENFIADILPHVSETTDIFLAKVFDSYNKYSLKGGGTLF